MTGSVALRSRAAGGVEFAQHRYNAKQPPRGADFLSLTLSLSLCLSRSRSLFLCLFARLAFTPLSPRIKSEGNVSSPTDPAGITVTTDTLDQSKA